MRTLILWTGFEPMLSDVNDIFRDNSLTSPEEILGSDQLQRVFAHRSQPAPMKNLHTSTNQPSPFYPNWERPPLATRSAEVCVTYGTRTHDSTGQNPQGSSI